MGSDGEGTQGDFSGAAAWDIDHHGPKPYKFIGFGDIYGPKPYKFIGFGDIHSPKPYKFIGFDDLAALKAKIKIINLRIRTEIDPKNPISHGKLQSGPSPGTPRGRGGQEQKLKIVLSTSRTIALFGN